MRSRGEQELYDLEQDPYEMNNLAGNPAYSHIVKDLRKELSQWRISQNDFEEDYR